MSLIYELFFTYNFKIRNVLFLSLQTKRIFHHNINFLILQYRWPVIQEQDQTHINSETHSCELAILKLSCKL